MGRLSILDCARRSGLVVWAEGDRLRIRGPKRLQGLVDELIANKRDVLAALAAPQAAAAMAPNRGPSDVSRLDAGGLPVFPADIRTWIACLRAQGARISLVDRWAVIEWPEGLGTQRRRVDWDHFQDWIVVALCRERPQ
jgi:hypothetical protein